MTRTVPARLARQPALDGMRGLAVGAVIVYHYNDARGFARGGYLGVDLFFVLSGFLITSLLLIDHAQTGRVLSTRFWARRARRLYPALLVLLVLIALYAAFVAPAYQRSGIRGSSLATLFYFNNYWLVVGSHAKSTTLLGHTWSLSIEEQFYLVWPVALAAIVGLTRRRTGWMLAALGVLIAASTIRMAMLATDTWLAYESTETRAASLLVGAALGIVLLGWNGPERRSARIGLEAAGLAGLAFLAWVITHSSFYGSSWLYHGGFLLVAVASAAVIAAAVQSTSPVLRRGLSFRPLVAIGAVSYGLYLFHLPVYYWLSPERVGFNGIALFVLRVAVASAIACASYFLIEMPIRRGALSWPRMRLVAPAALIAVVAVILVATIGNEAVPRSELTALQFRKLGDSTPLGSTRILVAGNGMAWGLGQVSGGVYLGDHVLATAVGLVGCSFVSGSAPNAVAEIRDACDKWSDDYRVATESFQPDISVLLIDSTEIFDRTVGGRLLRVDTPAYATYFLQQLERARSVLATDGTPLLLLTAPCIDTPNASPAKIQRDRRHTAWVNSVFLQFAEIHPHAVQIGHYGGYMCPGGVPRTKIGGRPVRDQYGVWLSAVGAGATWKWLEHDPVVEARDPRH